MIRKLKSISRSLGAIAVLVATTGCPTDNAKNPGQSLQTPTAPFAGIQVTMGSSRSMLEVGDDETVAVISVEVLRTADWTPVPNGTDAVFAATLGAIDSPSGGRAVTIDLINGRGSITLYPGDTDGTARVSVNVGGAIAVLNITIKPDPTGGVPPEPAPVQSTLTLVCSPGALGEDDPSDPVETTCEVTVLGDDGKPFKGAGVFLTSNSGLGTFASSGTSVGDILKTNSAGQITDILSIIKQALIDHPGTTFQITAHLGIEGGEKTTTFTITIVAAAAPDQAASIFLSATSSTTIEENDGTQTISLDALVRDQSVQPFDGALVQFEFGAGGGPGGFVPASEVSGSDSPTGHSTVMYSASETDVESFPNDQFTIVAKTVTTSGTITSNSVVVTIARTPAPTLNASFTTSTTTPCHDNLEGVSTVQFTDTSTGAILTWAWDLDGDGATDDANVPSPLFDYDGFTAGVARQVTLIISDGSSSDSAQVLITPTDCI